MNRVLRVHALAVSLYALTGTADVITTFDELKNSFLSGNDITAVLDIRLCQSDSGDPDAIHTFSTRQYKNLHMSFSSINGFHSLEESTGIDSFVFAHSGEYLKYNDVNHTVPFSPAGVISELVIRSNREVFLIYAVFTEGRSEQTYVYACNWTNGLVLNSHQ